MRPSREGRPDRPFDEHLARARAESEEAIERITDGYRRTFDEITQRVDKLTNEAKDLLHLNK